MRLKRNILLGVILVLLLYPLLSIYRMEEVISSGADPDLVNQRITAYQLSLWISWVVFVCVAVNYKWTTEKNGFFYFTYFFLVAAFAVFGFYLQEMINIFGISTRFEDQYTFGVFTAITNFVVGAILTAFLQAGVWWFTRRWHRR